MVRLSSCVALKPLLAMPNSVPVSLADVDVLLIGKMELLMTAFAGARVIAPLDAPAPRVSAGALAVVHVSDGRA